MRLLFASDSFKGSLSSERTAALLTKAAGEVFGDVECIGVPLADGGEGTCDAVIAARHGERIYTEVHGPLLEPRQVYYGKVGERNAVIEMAAASGLSLVPADKRNPLLTTTYGTGELISDALQRGMNGIVVAIGGSATNDGGMGCARALGVRFLDRNGEELEGRGRDLERVHAIDASGLKPQLRTAQITIMCDVNNPLCGPQGATLTYSAQKGAVPETSRRLEAGMQNYRDVIKREFGVDPDDIPGAGAAGGLGAALKIFLGGEMRAGIETVLDLVGFDKLLEGTDLVVTGEGRTDWQSCFGKVMQGVGKRAKARGVPAVGLSGSLGEGAAGIFDSGIASLMTTVDAPMPLEEAMERAEELYYRGAVRMFRLIRTGMEIA